LFIGFTRRLCYFYFYFFLWGREFLCPLCPGLTICWFFWYETIHRITLNNFFFRLHLYQIFFFFFSFNFYHVISIKIRFVWDLLFLLEFSLFFFFVFFYKKINCLLVVTVSYRIQIIKHAHIMPLKSCIFTIKPRITGSIICCWWEWTNGFDSDMLFKFENTN
jgi:hypothetical protein